MNILSFDLANFASSIALMAHGKIVFSEHSHEFRGQDVTLLSRFKTLLAEHSLTFQDLDCLVTTRGPGSFTGIRVALATAQGLSFAATVPAFGVTSFNWVVDSYAPSHPQDTLVLLESKRLELYGQLFDAQGQEKGVPFSLSPQHIADDSLYAEALCIGNGAPHMTTYGFKVDPFMPQALHLAQWMAKRMGKVPEVKRADYPCQPVYMRDADTGKS